MGARWFSYYNSIGGRCRPATVSVYVHKTRWPARVEIIYNCRMVIER